MTAEILQVILLTLSQGLLSLPDKKIVDQQLFEGISDTLRILIDAAGEIANDRLVQLKKDLDLITISPPINLVDVWRRLDKLTTSTAEVENDFIADS